MKITMMMIEELGGEGILESLKDLKIEAPEFDGHFNPENYLD